MIKSLLSLLCLVSRNIVIILYRRVIVITLMETLVSTLTSKNSNPPGSVLTQRVTAGLRVEGEKLGKYWLRVFQTQEVIRKTNGDVFLSKIFPRN